MTKPRVEIKSVDPSLETNADKEFIERTFGTPTSTEGFEPHMTNAGTPHLGPRRPSTLPPKPAERPRNFDDI